MRTSGYGVLITVALSTLFMPVNGQVLRPSEIAAKARPAVLRVNAMSGSTLLGHGSGFFIRSNGIFVTNYHVIEGAETLEIEISTGEAFDQVYLLAADPRRDIAILRVPVGDVPALELADDRSLEIGDAVYALGNPRGLDGTFSDGLLSARRMLDGVALLQVSAPIPPGSSGGPVLDELGRVIGLATLSVQDAQNLNLAVPARYIEPILELAGTPEVFSAAALPRGPVLGDQRPTSTTLPR